MTFPSTDAAGNRAAIITPWLLVALVPLLLTFAGWKWCPPMLNADSAMGFYVWNAREAGGAWNSYSDVDPTNIARDLEAFLSWWSPGQYQLPGLWREFGFSWGHVILLTSLFCCWLQAAGCWFLARDLSTDWKVAAWFAVVSTLQWHTLFSFGHFRGGDVLLYAATPWMLLWAWRVRDSPGWYLAGIPVLLAGGLYLKLSSVLIVFPLLMTAALSNVLALRRRPLALCLWIAASALLTSGTWLVVHLCFLSRGPNPDIGDSMREIFSLAAFAIASPWLAATGAGSLLGRIWWWRGRDVDEIWLTYGVFVAPVALFLWWWAGRWLLRPLTTAQRAALVLLVGSSIALFAVLLIRSSSIAPDDRYMRPAATVLLLALTMSINGNLRRQTLAKLTLLAIAAFGLGSSIQRCVSLAGMQSRGSEDITQQQLSKATLAKFAALDAKGTPRSILIYVPIPTLGMEILRQRVLLTDDFTIRRDHQWQGRVPEIVLAIPDIMENDGRATRVRGQFTDYRAEEWQSEYLDGWWFWTARDVPPARIE